MSDDPNFSTGTTGPLALAAAERLLAEAAVVADIECEGIQVGDTGRVYDVRPMLDLREHHPISADLNAIALWYAHQRGLIYVIERDTNGGPLVVRVLRSPT